MRRDTFGDRKVYAYLLGGSVLAFLLLKLCACGGGKGKEPDVPKLLGCAERVVQIITETPNCADIPVQLNRLLAAQAECFEALTGERAPSWNCGDGGR